MSHTLTLGKLQTALHEPPSQPIRVLTDRLWPRGVRKTDLGNIIWYKFASPETTLRQGLHRGLLSPEQFAQAYREQLQRHPETLQPLLELWHRSSLQLLTATHDPNTSYLLILRSVLIATQHKSSATF